MTLFTRPLLEDDSGASREVIRLSALRADERMADRVFAEVVANAEAASEAFGLPNLEMAAGLLAIVGANVTHFVLIAAMGPRTPSAAVFVVWVVVAMVLLVAARRRRLRRAAREVAGVLLHNGLCACCGYSLRGHYGEGGVVVCPECGAAWDDERVVMRHAFGGAGRGASS